METAINVNLKARNFYFFVMTMLGIYCFAVNLIPWRAFLFLLKWCDSYSIWNMHLWSRAEDVPMKYLTTLLCNNQQHILSLTFGWLASTRHIGKFPMYSLNKQEQAHYSVASPHPHATRSHAHNIRAMHKMWPKRQYSFLILVFMQWRKLNNWWEHVFLPILNTRWRHAYSWRINTTPALS